MTWLTTWPANGQPRHREHPSEQAAARHADDIVRRGDATTATYFELSDEESK